MSGLTEHLNFFPRRRFVLNYKQNDFGYSPYCSVRRRGLLMPKPVGVWKRSTCEHREAAHPTLQTKLITRSWTARAHLDLSDRTWTIVSSLKLQPT
jgi:hypothetical protein